MAGFQVKKSPLFGYTSADTPLHRMPPGLKLLLLTAFCIITAAAAGPVSIGLLSALLIIVLLLSGRQTVSALPAYWKIYIFFILSGIAKAAASVDIREGVMLTIRMLLMMQSGVVFYSTTRLTRLRKTFAPLPSAAKKVVDMIVMTLAFIPMIFKSADELASARYSRCFGKKSSPLRTIRLTAIPLMIELFLKAEEAADAWYSRGYSSNR